MNFGKTWRISQYTYSNSKLCIISNFPTLNKFYRLMTSKRTKIIRNEAKFISSALKLRKDLIAAS